MLTFANPARSTRHPESLRANRPLRLAALTAAVGITVAGCSGSGGDQPSTTPPVKTTTSSTTTTSTPPATTTSQTSTVPTTTKAVPPAVAGIPAAARANTDAGAEAFAKYYFAQLSDSITELDPSKTAGLWSKTCTYCSRLEGNVKSIRAGGGVVRGGQVTVSQVALLGRQGNEAQLTLRLKQAATSILKKDGSLQETSPATEKRGGLLLQFIAGRWYVAGVSIDA